MGNMKTMLLLFAGLTLSLAFFPPRQLAPPLTSLCSSSKSVEESSTILFRPARADDQGEIRRILLGMMMNPLSVDARNFLCADEGGILVGFGQVKAIGEGNFELASVHVSESHRRRGIGSNLVRQLVKDFATTHGPEQLENLYLITLTKQVDFYKKLGFEVIADKDAPTILRAEQAVGSVLQFLAGNSGVCTMRATPG